MKAYNFGALVVAACGAVVLSGCSTESIEVSYTMPARKINDVKAINVLALKVNADVQGPLGGADVSKAVGGLIQQQFSSQLYNGGYIATVDEICGSAAGVKAVDDFVKDKKSQHGYSVLMTETGREKASLTLTLTAKAESKEVTKNETVTLTATAFKRQGGKVPSSTPQTPVVLGSQPVAQRGFATTVNGTLSAALVSKDGKMLYSASYPVRLPDGWDFRCAAPSSLEALKAALTPAINEIVADISPYKGETVKLKANSDGDERVALLLEGKAFDAVIAAVDALKEKTAADWENQGIAYEATGDVNSAKAAYKEAIKLQPDLAGAKEGIKRIDDAKRRAKEVKGSGAKKDSTTTFKK